MNLLIVGGGFVNKGAEAMVRTAQAELKRRIPGAVFWACPDRMGPTTCRLWEQAGISLCPVRSSRAQALGLIARRLSRRPERAYDVLRNFSEWMPQIRCIQPMDGVIDVGGYAYGDPWGERRPRYAWHGVSFCRQTRKPYVFMPQAWGPFENATVRRWCKRIVRESALAVARDPTSRDWLSRLLGQPPEEVPVAPDIAFCFTGGSAEEGQALLRALGLWDGVSPVVGIAPNMRVYERTEGVGAENRYVRALADVCRRFCRLGARVVMIPHEILPETKGVCDDRLLCHLVEAMVREEGVATIPGAPTAETIKAVISQTCLLFGSRFHALVGALSSGVPALALGWSHKYVELHRLFDLAEYAVDYEAMDGRLLDRKVATLFADRRNLRERVMARLPSVRQDVDRLFDRVAARLIGCR